MNKLQKRIASAIAASAVFVQLSAPALATTSIVISGNGSGSVNYGTVTETSTTTVTQGNTANVTNNVDADANTGENSANYNTGGGTVVSTGDAGTNVSVANNLNSNAAHVDCCDNSGGTDVTINGNGSFSQNTVELTDTSTTKLDQDNRATVTNTVDSDTTTGENGAKLNTGGDVVVLTGKASTDVSVSTTANSNVATVGTPTAGNNPSASFHITGNGALSDNYIRAKLVKSSTLEQDNYARVVNNVDADADTGSNNAGFNTGGEAVINTGDAYAKAEVNNDVNFNYASLNCGCAGWDVMAKISGNGANPEKYTDNMHMSLLGDNVIDLTLANTKVYGQDNNTSLDNDLRWLDAKTGGNDNSSNTGEGNSDPLVATGDAWTGTSVSNSGNVNTIGGNPLIDWPWTDVNTNFNMSAVLALFGLYLS